MFTSFFGNLMGYSENRNFEQPVSEHNDIIPQTYNSLTYHTREKSGTFKGSREKWDSKNSRNRPIETINFNNIDKDEELRVRKSNVNHMKSVNNDYNSVNKIVDIPKPNKSERR